MKKSSVITGIIVLLFIINSLKGQTGFEKFYAPFSNQHHAAYSIVPSIKSGYILSGKVYQSYGYQSLLLMKIDTSGNIVWYKRYGSDYSSAGYCIQRTLDSCYIIVGVIGDPFYTYVLKINEDGDTLWTRRFQINYSYTCLHSVYPTPDGQFVCCGFASYDGAGSNWLILKLNSNGQLVWYKLNGDPLYDRENYARSIDATSDNGFIVAGQIMWYNQDSTQSFLAKTDSEGNPIWTKFYPEVYVNNSGANAVKQTMEGGFVWGGVIGGKGVLTKTNDTGDTIWRKQVIPYESEVESVVANPDSSIVCCGTCYDNGLGSMNVFLIKTDKSGNVIWRHYFSQGNYRIGNDCRATGDNGYIIAGQGADSAYVIKADSNSTITDVKGQGNRIKTCVLVYPNPNKGVFNLLPDRDYKAAEIVDMLNRTIYKTSEGILTGVVFGIDLPDLKSGIYFLRLITPGGASAVYKVIIR